MEKYPIIELVVKIASRCNLNCKYCYEYNMGDETKKSASKFMTNAVAKQLGKRIQEHITEFQLKEYNLGLHGGEPLLMSPSKLDELVCSLKSTIDPTVELFFSLQTNAILMSKEHIDIFKKHNIRISISLDGLKVVVHKLQHAVNCRDGLRVNLVSALRLNHVDHFFHHVHVGSF